MRSRVKLAPPDYADFVAAKLQPFYGIGMQGPFDLPASLFDHQKALTTWSLKRGKSALFADTGLGKSRMEMAWCDQVTKHTQEPVILYTPLAVAIQMQNEGHKIGIHSTIAREQSDIRPGINITNYERMHKFESSQFGGVCLDESGCIKHHTSQTFQMLTSMYQRTEFKLAATATPAPNDWVEFGTHAEFLGICTRAEMLAEFFTHDGGDTSVWRLKKHAQSVFWKWVVSWGVLIKSPTDLGFDGSAYILPKMHVHEHVVDFEIDPDEGTFFPRLASSLQEQHVIRRQSTSARVRACADVINNSGIDTWLVWCDLNDESEQLKKSIHMSVEVRGSTPLPLKESTLMGFADGTIKRMISKTSIAGYGLNYQRCSHMAFVGATNSYESYYQAVRRCYRFGQTQEVHIHLFSSRAEQSVLANLKRKEDAAERMSAELIAVTRGEVMDSVFGATRMTNDHSPSVPMELPTFI